MMMNLVVSVIDGGTSYIQYTMSYKIVGYFSKNRQMKHRDANLIRVNCE